MIWNRSPTFLTSGCRYPSRWDTKVTRRHYAKQLGTVAHREPLVLGAGEVYADLIDRVVRGGQSLDNSADAADGE
jgi:hypothetical protein